jgi:hypothetical protein
VVVKRKSGEDEHGYSRDDGKPNVKIAKFDDSCQTINQYIHTESTTYGK